MTRCLTHPPGLMTLQGYTSSDSYAIGRGVHAGTMFCPAIYGGTSISTRFLLAFHDFHGATLSVVSACASAERVDKPSHLDWDEIKNRPSGRGNSATVVRDRGENSPTQWESRWDVLTERDLRRRRGEEERRTRGGEKDGKLELGPRLPHLAFPRSSATAFPVLILDLSFDADPRTWRRIEYLSRVYGWRRKAVCLRTCSMGLMVVEIGISGTAQFREGVHDGRILGNSLIVKISMKGEKCRVENRVLRFEEERVEEEEETIYLRRFLEWRKPLPLAHYSPH
ncbi:hypothetical protein BDZ91DRAFT_814797 [Kalaharituber pfeilii]|nr:hypothetical protein BDZ91DRAFT_814797 [Kalaharituber pfeilii]